MTVAVGSEVGAAIEAGGRTALGQGARTGQGRELGTNWFSPQSGNLATGLSSTAPNFRSSWQSMVNAWRGVSRGTNGVENDAAEESGITSGITRTEEGLTRKNAISAFSATTDTSSVQGKLPTALPNSIAERTTAQTESQSQLIASQWRSAQAATTETASAANEGSDAGSRPGKAGTETAGFQSPRTKKEAAAQTVESPVETFNWFPLATAPLPPGVASLSQAPVSLETSAQAHIAGTTLPPASSSALAGWGSDAGAIDSAGTNAAAFHSNDADATSNGAHTMRTGQASPQHSTTQSHAAHETSALPLDDTSESAASVQTALSASSKLLTADTRSASPTAATGEYLSNHSVPASSADHFRPSELAGSAKPSAGPHGIQSGAAQTSVSTAQDPSNQTLEHAAPSASSHAAAQESASTATSHAAVQPASIDATAAGLRTPVAHASAAPASGVTAASSPASAQDTFTALDRDSSLGTPAWTHAGGQHAEAGFEDPELGWVGVRADLNTSGIHATLVPSSSDAAQSLSGHLAGLSSHLVEQQAPVASLSMGSPGGSGIENSNGQSMQQGAEGNAQGNTSAESQATMRTERPLDASTSTQAAAAESGVAGTQAYPGDLRGRHISVMA